LLPAFYKAWRREPDHATNERQPLSRADAAILDKGF